jgi:hypothetical protein
METPIDEIARLDMAAQAKGGLAVTSRLRWILLFLSLFITALAIEPTASFYETLSLRVAAVFLSLMTVILWSNWWYKLYLPAILIFCFGIGGAFFWRPLATELDWSVSALWCVGFFVLFSYAWWKQAGIFTTVNSPGWEQARSKVDAWWCVLTARERDQEVIEFSTGSFWTGYYTYRLLRSGPCWAIAKLWNGKVSARSSYRVQELSAVTFSTLPSGEKQVTIGESRMRAVNLSMPNLANPKESMLPKSA